MSPRGTGQTSPCNQHQAQVRLGHAVKYREVAELVAVEGDDDAASASVAEARLRRLRHSHGRRAKRPRSGIATARAC